MLHDTIHVLIMASVKAEFPKSVPASTHGRGGNHV